MTGLHSVISGLRNGVVTPTEAADRLEILLARQADVNALAREAVDAMGDVFYDADPQIDGYGAGELRSNAISCVAAAIRKALPASPHCDICGPARPAGHGLCEHHYQVFCQVLQHCPRLLHDDGRCDFKVIAGSQTLALIEVRRRERPGRNRTQRNRAVKFTVCFPVGNFEWQTSSLEAASVYLERLGLNPEPLLERARERGWEVQ